MGVLTARNQIGLFSNRSRVTVLLTATLSVLCLFAYVAKQSVLNNRVVNSVLPGVETGKPSKAVKLSREKFHILLPATDVNPDLCKTLLSTKILGYPTPKLVAWNFSFDVSTQMAGGSHMAKISEVLRFLEDLKPSQNDDLVLMLDAYDIWFQLKPDVLLKRFDAINAEADQRLIRQLYPWSDVKHIEQKIIFGAGKRCAPNQMHTIACYPVPASPLPADLYGNNTDTAIGRNKYYSHRQRYLNSGYVMGKAVSMRKLFRAAAKELKETPDHMPEDNGSGGSDFIYHGSDQSIFNTLFGKQEYWREYHRQRHAEIQGMSVLPVHDVQLEGTHYDNPINPPFYHEKVDHRKMSDNWELGIGLDYWSELGHQTANAEKDGTWLRFDQPWNIDEGRSHFDCPPRLEKAPLLSELAEAERPIDFNQDTTWKEMSLYSNLCTGRVPVMVHHNGDKNARAYTWDNMWFRSYDKKMLEQSNIEVPDLVTTDRGDVYAWEGLCGEYSDMLD